MPISIGDAILYLSASDKQYNSDLKSAKSKAQGWVAEVGDVVKTGLGTALGFVTTDLIGGAIRGLQNLAVTALDSYSNYERLGLSLENLVARELQHGQVVTQTGTAIVNMTEAERQKVAELTDQYRLKEIAVATTQSEIDAILKKGADTANLEVEKRQIKIRDLQRDMGDLQGKIDDLNSHDGQLVTTLKQVTINQMSHSEAMAQAGPKAQALLQWIQKLAVLSPFTQEEVANAFKLQMAYGFTSDEAKNLTTALINFAAGSGASGDSMQRIALALGQIKAKGKLAGQEVLQLVNAGLPVTQILADAFHKTTAEIEDMRSNGLLKADEVIKAITDTLNNDFAGAAEKQATSWAGLRSTLEDIQNIGLREFFEGTFKAIQPYLADFVNVFEDGDLQKKIQDVGDKIGSAVGGAMTWLKDNAVPVIRDLYIWFEYFVWAVMGGQDPLDALAKILAVVVPPELKGLIDGVKGAWDDLKEAAGQTWEKLKPIRDALQDIFDAIKNNDPKALGEAVANLFKAITDNAGTALAPLGDLIKGWFTNAASGIGDIAKDWGKKFWEGFSSAMQENFDISGKLDEVKKTIQTWIDDLIQRFPVLFAVLATAGVVLADIWNAIVATLSPAISQLVDEFVQAWPKIAQAGQIALQILPVVAAVIGAILLALLSVVVGVMDGIVTAIHFALPIFQDMENGVAKVITNIQILLGTFGTYFKQLFSGDIPGALQTAWTAFQALLSIVGGLFDALIPAIFLPIGIVLGFIEGFVIGVIGFFQNLYDELVGHSIIPDMMAAILKVFTEKFEEIKTKVSTFIGDVIKIFDGFRKNFVDMGGWLMDDVLKGILLKTSQIINAVTGMVKDAIAAAGNALGQANPFGGGVSSSSGSGTKGSGSANGVRDSGGPGKKGLAYVINPKAGPEVFMPDSDGTFFPNADKNVPDLSAYSGQGASGGNQGPQEASLEIDGMMVGRLVLPGVLAELTRQGLKVVPIGEPA